MKKICLLAILAIVSLFSGFSEEMNLWCNDHGAEQFATLTLEEQYRSYINSFKDIPDPRTQPHTWAASMIKQYGRDVLPYLDETLKTLSLSHKYRKPYDSTLDCVHWLFEYLIESNTITEEERLNYIEIMKGKIGEYLLEFRIIDGTVRAACGCLIDLGYEGDFQYALYIKDYFENLYGIEIEIGDLGSMWEE